MAIIVCPKCHTENQIDDATLPELDTIQCSFCRHVFRAPLSPRKDQSSDDEMSPLKAHKLSRNA